jgi:hypothetical protein
MNTFIVGAPLRGNAIAIRSKGYASIVAPERIIEPAARLKRLRGNPVAGVEKGDRMQGFAMFFQENSAACTALQRFAIFCNVFSLFFGVCCPNHLSIPGAEKH